MTYDGDLTLPSPRFSRIITWHTRTDTNDGALVAGIIGNDEYDLGCLPQLTGTAIDIGAHIGVVALALAADHPDLKIIAVEPVPQNVEGLRMNVERNGFADRITVIEAAGAAPGTKRVEMYWNYRWAENSDQAYTDDSRFIANIFGPLGSDADKHRVKAVSLDSLMEGIDRLALLKVDCEGCEWNVLRSKRVADIDYILGEFHNGGGMAAVHLLLDATHEVEQIGGGGDVGLFRAVRW